ncbi:MAG: PD40 domain-containing protein [Bacteroidales bacterium]|nr:PD40 domain-containing protein [Bacteroidales bacterium]
MKGYKQFRLLLIILVFSNIICVTAYPQTQSELKEMFLEAESYFLFEEYADALPLYQKILHAEPENDHIRYKIGICYLNNPYQKEKSISYLQKAVKNINAGFRENNFKEKQAPPESYYYLGNAYRVNNRLNEAIETYEYFKTILDPVVYDASLVDKQIKACKVALDIEKRPNYIVKQNLGEDINSRFAEINPIVSGDESTLVFTKKLQFYDGVFYCKKENGKWSYPVNLTPSFALDGNSYCTGLSWNGSELLVYRSDGFDGNVYISFRDGEKWSKLEKLGGNINTKYWESHASFSPDGQTLYFTSNRNGGFGGLDIYTSKRLGKNNWGEPVNFGQTINSEYNEDSPFLTGDGKTIYFSSQGHYNMGGFDIFYSTLLENGTWSKPLNAGYPINTTGDDLFFVPVKNGEFAYYAMFDPELGYGLDDLYRFEIFSDLHPRKFTLKGLALKTDEVKFNFENTTVKLIDKKTNKTFSETSINTDGTYSLNAQSGKFDLVISGKGIAESRETINIPVAHPSDIFAHQTTLSASTEEASSQQQEEIPQQIQPKLEIETENYTVSTGEPVAIRLNVDRNTTLDINIYNNDSLIKNEQLELNRRRFVYLYTPREGTNMLEFTLSDAEGNSVTKKVVIEYTPAPAPESIAEQVNKIPVKELESFRNLSQLSNGNLQKYLESLDFEQLGINSASELYDYLIKEMPGNSYTLAEIDNLFINYLAQKELSDYFEEIKKPASEKMKSYLSSLNPDSSGIYFPEKLVDILYSDIPTKPYPVDDLNYALTNIASKNTGNINDYLDILNANSSQEMGFALRKLESGIKNFAEPFQLTMHLYANAGEDRYTKKDVENLLKESSVNLDMDYLHQSMILNGKGNLKQTLSDLNLNTENIKTSKELLQYLWANAANKGYTNKEVIELVEYIKANSDKNLELFRQYLAKHASGNLKAVIQSLDLKEKGISTFADLLNYLINTSELHDYNRQTIYQLLLDIIGTENTADFVKLLKKNAGLDLNRTLELIDMQQFSSPYELLQHLIGYTGEYKFTEQDLLNLLLKLVFDKGLDVGETDITADSQDKTAKKKLATILILANGLLLLIIIFFILRKKRKKKLKKT